LAVFSAFALAMDFGFESWSRQDAKLTQLDFIVDAIQHLK
jgi:hypothetical protein